MQNTPVDLEKMLLPKTPADPTTENYTTPAQYLEAIQANYPNSRASQSGRNEWFYKRHQPEIAQWFVWDVMILAVTSYFGAVPRKKKLTQWQKIAYDFTRRYPTTMLSVHVMRPYRQYDFTKHAIDNTRLIWHIQWRGEYTDFCLPSHNHGGEHTWATRDGIWLHHTNVD